MGDYGKQVNSAYGAMAGGTSEAAAAERDKGRKAQDKDQ